MAYGASVHLKLKPTPNNTESHPHRILKLDGPYSICKIGRGSRSGAEDLFPSSENGLFDSRVMSREHAIITADWNTKQVWIEDTGSMHGTRLNERTIKPRTRELLMDEDVVRFGAEVSRGTDYFPPLEVLVSLEWFGCPRNSNPQYTPTRPRNTFSVPDFSDDEFDEDDEVQILGDMARKPSVEVVIPPAQNRAFSVPDSDNSEIDSMGSSDVSDDEEPHEINTSPSSPAGLTDAEKRADLEIVAAAAKAAPTATSSPQNTGKRTYEKIDMSIDECITESEFDAEDDGFWDEDEVDGMMSTSGVKARAPSPSDAAMPKPPSSSFTAPPLSTGYPFSRYSPSSYSNTDLGINRTLPGVSSFTVAETHLNPLPSLGYSSSLYPTMSPTAPTSTYCAPYSQILTPASYSSPWNLSGRPRATDNLNYVSANSSSPAARGKHVASPTQEAKPPKRKADLISTGEAERVETEETPNKSPGPDVQEIPAYDFYHPSVVSDAEQVKKPELEQLRASDITELKVAPPVTVFHGDRTAKEPPKKRVRLTHTRTRQGSGGFGRYVATAVAGMAIGAIGAVWSLVALPDDFFA